MCRQVRCNRRDLPLSTGSTPGVAPFKLWCTGFGAASQDLRLAWLETIFSSALSLGCGVSASAWQEWGKRGK